VKKRCKRVISSQENKLGLQTDQDECN